MTPFEFFYISNLIYFIYLNIIFFFFFFFFLLKMIQYDKIQPLHIKA